MKTTVAVPVTRNCVNCQGQMVLLCDPRMDLEWFHCSYCGRTEDKDA